MATRLANSWRLGARVGTGLNLYRGVDLAGGDALLIVEFEQRPLGDDVVAEPRGVGQQVADRDRPRRGAALDRGLVQLHAHVLERGQDVADRLVELEFAVLDQDHRRHRGDRLGHRIDSPQAVGAGGGSVGVGRDLARGDEHGRAIADAERADDARHLAAGHIRIEQRAGRRQRVGDGDGRDLRRGRDGLRERAAGEQRGERRAGQNRCQKRTHQAPPIAFAALAKTVGNPASPSDSTGHQMAPSPIAWRSTRAVASASCKSKWVKPCDTVAVEHRPVGRERRFGEPGLRGLPRSGRQRAHPAEQSLGRAADEQDIVVRLRPEDRAVALRLGGLGRFDRKRLLVARREGRAMLADRAKQAARLAREADRRAEIHHRLREIARAGRRG